MSMYHYRMLKDQVAWKEQGKMLLSTVEKNAVVAEQVDRAGLVVRAVDLVAEDNMVKVVHNLDTHKDMLDKHPC